MLSLPPSVRIYLCLHPTDMRRSFDGLAAMTAEIMGENPLSGHLFVFRNRRGDRIKILYWDRSGYCLWYKRLEEGTFHFPHADSPRLEIEGCQLSLILEGIQVSEARQHKRFRLRENRHSPIEIF